MADVHDKETRSYNMSRISGKNTKPEMIVRKFLHANGFRFRINQKSIVGKPDIVLRKFNTIIDVRGCFWHLHKDCKYGNLIVTESTEITAKRSSASLRDKRNEEEWSKLGWNLIIIWECELEPKKKTSAKRIKTLNSIVDQLRSANTSN